MHGLVTRKKLLFVGVIAISAVVIFVMQRTVTGASREINIGSHLRLLAKSDAQRKIDTDKYLEKNIPQDRGPSVDDIYLDGQDFSLKPDFSFSNASFNDLKSSSVVNVLADALGYKLKTLTTQERKLRPACHNPDVVANSCDDGKCLQTSFSTGLKERVAELVNPSHLTISSTIQQVLDNTAKDVPKGVEFIIVTAASSNHFLEVQGLIKNIHENVETHFKNFTFVFFNIGLTREERAQVAKHCKCHVVDFPFDDFPTFVRNTKCYAWKPMILNSLVNNANTILWVDSSIRFDKDPSYLSKFFQEVDKRTIQFGSTQVISPFRTYRGMYHFFGDEPCMYLDMFQGIAGVFGFKGEFFVKRAVLDPWVACAISENCICPGKEAKKSCIKSRKMVEKWEERKGPIVYGLCHRFDQSAVSLILHKLYQGYFHWVTFHIGSYLQIKRDDNTAYFKSLEE